MFAPSPMNGRGVPPIRSINSSGLLSAGLNQIADPLPEKPSFRTIDPLGVSGGKSRVRLEKRPVPTWLTQISNSPSWSARNGTNFPSGEISAPSSVPSQSVKRVNRALASGFSGSVAGLADSHAPTPTASGADLAHPDIELAVVVGEERHELPVRRDLGGREV